MLYCGSENGVHALGAGIAERAVRLTVGEWVAILPAVGILLRKRSPRARMPARVVASVIQRNGKLLVCERPAHKRHGGLWEFPGGKIEPGESDFDAARRELGEELAVEVVAVGEVEYSVLDVGAAFQIDFVPVSIMGEPQCLEHARIAWVSDDELLRLPLAPSDRRYVRHRLRA
jgi:8-oxo-dGTP diphosphatase